MFVVRLLEFERDLVQRHSFDGQCASLGHFVAAEGFPRLCSISEDCFLSSTLVFGTSEFYTLRGTVERDIFLRILSPRTRIKAFLCSKITICW